MMNELKWDVDIGRHRRRDRTPFLGTFLMAARLDGDINLPPEANHLSLSLSLHYGLFACKIHFESRFAGLWLYT